MDLTSLHMPYIATAYGFGALILGVFSYWILKEDRKASQKLSLWPSDET